MWNLIAFLLGVAANVLTIPLALATIGPAAFGTAGLVLAVVAPMTLIGTSIALSTARAIASEGTNVARARKIFGSALSLALVGAVLGGLLLLFVGPIVAGALFRIAPSAAISLPQAFAWAALAWAVAVLSVTIQSLYVARQFYIRIAQVNAVGTVVGSAAIIVCVRLLPSVGDYMLLLSCGPIAVVASWCVLLFRENPAMLVRPMWDWSSIRRLTGFGGWQILTQISGIAATQADRYMLGAIVRPEAVGYYNVSQRLEEVAYIGVIRSGEVLFPVFSAESTSSLDRQADLYARACWLLNSLAACVFGPLIALSYDLLRVWTTAVTARTAAAVLATLATAGLVGCGTNVLGLYALGSGRPKLNTLMALVTAGVATASSVVLLSQYGLAAAGLGSLIAMCCQFAVGIAILRHLFGSALSWRRLGISTLWPILVGSTVGWTSRQIGLPTARGWIDVIILYSGLSIAIAFIIAASSALSGEGRRSLQDIVQVLGAVGRRVGRSN